MAKRLFPHADMFKWLSYGNGNLWKELLVDTNLDSIVICFSSLFILFQLRIFMRPISWFICADGKHPACDQSYIGRREFSFTLDNDIYLRFQSFNCASELENGIKDKCPFKIDIGPVYSVDVRFISVTFFITVCLLIHHVSWSFNSLQRGLHTHNLGTTFSPLWKES